MLNFLVAFIIEIFSGYDIYIYISYLEKISKTRATKNYNCCFSFDFGLVWAILRRVLTLYVVFGHFTSFSAPWHRFYSQNDGNQFQGCRLFPGMMYIHDTLKKCSKTTATRNYNCCLGEFLGDFGLILAILRRVLTFCVVFGHSTSFFASVRRF